MLTGFSAEELEPFHLPEDDGEVKTLFYVRAIPRGKLDELQAQAFDRMGSDEKTTGDTITRNKKYNREVVRWGLAKHEHFVTEKGKKEIPCGRVKATFASQDFDVVDDATLDLYERSNLPKVKVKARVDGPPGPEGQPLFKAGDLIDYQRTLLDAIAERIALAQTLSPAERRALPGAGVAAG